jgi:hypothetical protein
VMLLHTRAADVGGLHTGIDTREIARSSRPHLAPDGLRRAAQQGDRRAQRLRARVRHPPGRRPQGPVDLRDHGRADRRPGREPARARQALRPRRAAPGARGARPPARRRAAQRGVQALQGGGRPQEAGHRDGPRGARDRRAARGAARMDRRVVRRGGLLAPAAARHRGGPHAGRRRGAGRLHRRRAGRRDLPRINAATRREARLREFRIDAVTAARTRSARPASCSSSRARRHRARASRRTSSRPRAQAYVRALSNCERKVLALAEQPASPDVELTPAP